VTKHRNTWTEQAVVAPSSESVPKQLLQKLLLQFIISKTKSAINISL